VAGCRLQVAVKKQMTPASRPQNRVILRGSN
jgi:hypothetical protein